MTSNIDKAARAVSKALHGDHGGIPWQNDYIIAHALADAGLLTPDLPEPRMILSDGSPMWVGNLETSIGVDDGLVYIDGGLLTPGEAKEEAAMILAAADHAEGVGRA